MSERDELAEIIVEGYTQDYGDEEMADAILAAGYRKVPDDCVVVGRINIAATPVEEHSSDPPDISLSLDAAKVIDRVIVDAKAHLDQLSDEWDAWSELRNEIQIIEPFYEYPALTATRHGEDV